MRGRSHCLGGPQARRGLVGPWMSGGGATVWGPRSQVVGGVDRIVIMGRGAGGPGARGLIGVCVGVTVGRVVALWRKGRGPASGGPTAVLAAVVGMGGPGAWHWVVPPGGGHLLLPHLLLLGRVAPGHPAQGEGD